MLLLLPYELLTIVLSKGTNEQLWMFSQTCKHIHMICAEIYWKRFPYKRRMRLPLEWPCNPEYFVTRYSSVRCIFIEMIPPEQCCALAARAGNLPMLKWCHRRKMPLVKAMCAAAEGGHLDVIEWLLRKKQSTYGACMSAAKEGQLKVFSYLHTITKGKIIDWYACVNAAASNGHVHILQLWRELYGPYDYLGVIRDASLSGHLNVLQWVKSMSGNVCFQPGLHPNYSCIHLALTRNHLHIIKWYAEKYALPPDAIELASSTHIRLDVIQFLYKMELPWGDYVCRAALSAGRLEIINWAIEKGSLWVCPDVDIACRMGYGDIVKWGIEHGCPVPYSLIKYICKHDDVDMLIFALAHGLSKEHVYIWDFTYERSMKVLTWALLHGWDVGPYDRYKYIKAGDFDMVQCMLRGIPELFSETEFNLAELCGHQEIADMLFQNLQDLQLQTLN